MPPAAAFGRGDDSALVEQVQAGDMAAFSRLVVKYQDRVLNTCWRLAGNLEDAQDLAQEAFLRALESIHSFRRQAGFYTWLFRIAVNLALSQRRRTSRRVQLSLHDGDGPTHPRHQAARLAERMAGTEPAPPVRLSAREREQMIMDALAQLDDEHRAVVILRDIESCDYQQIAGILEIPVGTVKSRLHRARMILRDRLKEIL